MRILALIFFVLTSCSPTLVDESDLGPVDMSKPYIDMKVEAPQDWCTLLLDDIDLTLNGEHFNYVSGDCIMPSSTTSNKFIIDGYIVNETTPSWSAIIATTCPYTQLSWLRRSVDTKIQVTLLGKLAKNLVPIKQCSFYTRLYTIEQSGGGCFLKLKYDSNCL